MKSNKLNGVIIALPTPLNNDEELDTFSLHKLIDHCINKGAHGIMILGTMGEGPALLDQQKMIMVKETVNYVAGRIPVLATASEVSTQKSINLAQSIDQSGVDYLVCTAPFYYKFPDPESILWHIRKIANHVEAPLIFYNALGFTGNPVNVDTIEKILNMDKVAGIKDSSCNYGNFVELLRRYPHKKDRPGFIMQGDESIFDASLIMGADGVVSGGGVCFIDMLIELYKTGVSDDMEKVMQLQQSFHSQLIELLSSDPARNWMYNIKKRLVDMHVIANAYVTTPFLGQ